MKTSLLLATLFVGGTSAFTSTTSKTATTSALSASKFADEVGAQMPLGFWDPLGMLGDEDQKRFDRLREVEVKHGRIAMLGVVGYLTTYAGVRCPGMEAMPKGFAALDPANWDDYAKTNILWTLGTIGLLELCVMKDQTGKAEFPGDYRNGGLDFGWWEFDDATKKRKRSIELNNGRAAQMGLLGLMVHEQMGNVDVLLPLASK